MKKNKKGFTLIELLAVIVILAIIALIAVPLILNIIERARKGAFTRSAENVLKASNLYYTNSLLEVNQPEEISFTCDGEKCLSSKLDEQGNQINLNVDGSMGKGTVNIGTKGEVDFELSNGSYCALKQIDSKKITVNKGNCNGSTDIDEEVQLIIENIYANKSSITIGFKTSKIDETKMKCEYGIDENYGLNGTITKVSDGNYKCVINNLTEKTKYNYKITVEDNKNNSKSETGDKETETYIDIVYYNPETGSKCTDYTESQSTTGTKTGCMKWYAYKDNGSTYDMILDHNTTATIAYNSNNVNTSMLEVAEALTNDTSTWQSSLNARLITADEIATITGNTGWNSATSTDWFYLDSNNQTQTATSKGAGKYSWLYDYTKNCTSYGCNIEDSSTNGYWTSTPYAGHSAYAWLVNYYGDLGFYIANNNSYGLRPVITINK